jgi:hypothetical protein
MRFQGQRLHSHAPTLAARGQLHFNELLILVWRGRNNNRLDAHLCKSIGIHRHASILDPVYFTFCTTPHDFQNGIAYLFH